MTQLGIRPESVTPVASGDGHISGHIDVVENLGADTYLIVNCGDLGQVTVRITGENSLEAGASIGLHLDLDKLHYFDKSDIAL